MFWKQSKKHFTMDQYIKDRRTSTYDYEDDGITIIDMKEDEILEVIKEFYYDNLNKDNKDNKDNKYKKLQKLFWKKIILANQKLKLITHNKIHPESNVSISWLKKIEK